jgi:magnesium transporter
MGLGQHVTWTGLPSSLATFLLSPGTMERMTSDTVASLETVTDLLEQAPHNEHELARLADASRHLPLHDLMYLVQSRPTSAAVLFRVLDKDRALRVFEDLPSEHQAELVSALRTPQVAEFVDGLDPDDRADLLEELPAAVAERMLTGLPKAERDKTATVLGYPKDSIGRFMSPEVLSLSPDLTAGEALARIRAHIAEPETIYMLPVVDATRVLLSVVGLRSLLAADADTPVSDLAHPALSARAVDDREQTARRFRTEKLLAMPIVDKESRLVGILTIDDVMDILDEEDQEDAARAGGSEPLTRAYLSTSIVGLVRSRIVWLVVLAVSAILTVQVLGFFEDRLDQVVVLALFIPLLTGTGGNTGNQAATTVTRALAIGEVRVRDLPRVVWRELRVGMLLGATLGTGGLVISGLVYGWGIGIVMGVTLLSICTMAAVVGGVMPLIAKKVGADPAVFSNPFISTFCDATGLVIYFSVATAVLGL